MYIKVRILIGGDVISLKEVTVHVGIRYKGRRPQPSRGKFREKFREKLGSILTETFQVWLSLVGATSVSNILQITEATAKLSTNYTTRYISTNISVLRN